MTELPVASLPPAPAIAVRASPRATPAHNGLQLPNLSPFQGVLALELGLALDGPFPPGAGVPAATANAGGEIEAGEDMAQTAIAADASLGLALIGVAPLPPAPASRTLPTVPGAAPLSPAFAPTMTGRGGLAPDPRKNQLDTAAAPPGTEAEPPITSAAADAALPGELASSVEGELRRDLAFDAGRLDRHKAAPVATAAIHPDGTAPAQVAPAPVVALEVRLGERGWDQGLGDKLIWMAGQKQQVAELSLNPPDLGPLKITLTLDRDQASAQFVCAHAPVREAVEAAMPRLREMLADAGITLGNASVSTDAFREQAQPQQKQRAYPAGPAATAADAGAVTLGERLLRRSRGLVDTFA